MDGLISSVGLVVMPKPHMPSHGHCVVFLEIVMLLTVITAASPVADESVLDFTQHPMGFLEDLQSSTETPPSTSPTSHHTVFKSLDSPGARPSIFEPSRETGIRHLHWGLVDSEISKSFTASELLAEVAHPLSIPSLNPSRPLLTFSPHFKTKTKPSTDLKLAYSAQQSHSTSPKPSRSRMQPPSNISISSLRPSLSITSTSPPLGLKSEWKTTFSIQQDGAKQIIAISASLSPNTTGHPELTFTDSSAVESHSNIPDMNPLRPSNATLKDRKPAHDLNVLSNPDKFLTHGYYVPFTATFPTSPLSERTEVSIDDVYPTNTMEFDWGSGDYLETMSFFNINGEDYSLVTKLPTDSYDLEDYTEQYDTSFPSRVGISFSSLDPFHATPLLSLTTAYTTMVPLKSIYPSSVASTDTYTLEATPTANIDIPAASDIDWPDTYTIHPTDVLLPDMNSLEFYTTQLTKDNNSSDTEAEHRGNVTVVLIDAADITPTTSFTNDTKETEEESNDPSGFEPHAESTTEESPRVNASEPLLYPSIVPTHFFESSSSTWGSNVFATEGSLPTLTVGIVSTAFAEARLPIATPLLSDDAVSSSSLTDVHWFVTEPFSQSAIHTDPVLTTTMAFSPAPTQPTAYNSDETTPRDSNVTTVNPLNISLVSTEPVSNVTLVIPDMLGDQRVTVDGDDMPVTMTQIPTNDEDYGVPVVQTTTAATFTSHQATTRRAITTEASTSVNVIPTTSRMTTSTVTKSRQYLCKLDRPAYFVKLGFPSGTTVGYVKSQVRDILKVEFNKSVELQVVDPPPKFVFRVVSGPVVYTAISVINALRRSGHHFQSLSPNWTTPDRKYQIHTVLQFVPSNIDVRFCNFSERIESGLTMAFAEVRRRSKDSTNFTVHIVNVTKYQEQQLIRQPVDIIFTVHDLRGYLIGSEVSNALMKLTTVEFSYYMGFPVLQIAEPFHYPELNTSQLLRSSWIRTVLLGVLDHKVGERTFQANMERRVAILLREAIGLVGRVKRATIIENSSVQVVSASRLVGADYPLEIVYFVEGASGQRMPADEAVNLLNRMDVQRAAIILGYRVQGILAQPVEKVASSPTDAENTNVWIVIGVVIPLLVVIIIISILYWKLCRTDKLEFQPDAMTAIQQRQKSTGSLGVSRTSLLQTLPSIEQDIYDSEWEYVEEEEMYEDEEQEEEEEEEVKRGELQASSVKGFDFAKLHLGQQSKDDVMVIQEAGLGPGPPPVSTKDGLSPSSNGEVPTPISKSSASSSKVSRSGRRRERISPSDGDSVVSDHSSERELAEENLRAHATANDSKQPRKLPINVLNGIPPMNGTNEQLSSASIFEHVDRMSRATDTSRRLPNKVQLIAMQPIPGPPFSGKLSDTNQINKEIQVSLRHKSEIEHHRNKIRLRAKRKGHYDFPAMDDVTSGLADVKDQDCIYQKAQLQIDKILDPDAQVASIFMASKKSGRGRRSPKQRMKGQLNGGMMEADKDHLITEENDAAYRKCPGVNNVAYVSDPDQVQGSSHRSHYPTDDVFLGPGSSPPGQAPPPPPYIPPQPSIEEARLQMHSLLDDAFALVSPTSQGITAGITLPGVNSNLPASSPPGQGPRPWGPPYPALSPFSDRFGDLGVSASSVQGMIPRHGLGTSYLPPAETEGQCERLQQDNLYSSKGLYTVEVPLSARPRPVGGTTGIQLHHLTQVGLSNRMNGYPAGVRAPPGNPGVGWNHYHDENFSRTEPEKDVMTRNSNREPTAAHVQLDTPAVGYLSAPPPLDTSPPTHSSASLIKAIREELLRLSQKQAAVSSYNG